MKELQISTVGLEMKEIQWISFSALGTGPNMGSFDMYIIHLELPPRLKIC